MYSDRLFVVHECMYGKIVEQLTEKWIMLTLINNFTQF